MRLESALYSSSQGLYCHGSALSIVGDNISNASTTGYKYTRADFDDLVAKGPDVVLAGTDKTSVGNGAVVGDSKIIYTGGTIEQTGRSLDCGIDGEGFFILSDGAKQYFSRAGEFSVTSDGSIVNAEGLYLQGYTPESAEALSNIKIDDNVVASKETTSLALSGNVASSAEITSVLTSPVSFSEINENASFITGDIAVYDSLGNAHDLTIAFYKTGVNEVTAQTYINGSEVGKEDGIPVAIGEQIKMNFESNGTMTPASKEKAKASLNIPYSNGASAGNVALDLSNFTQLSSLSYITSTTQDGYSTSNIISYDFGKNGEFYAILEDSTRHQLATIALADTIDRDFTFQRAGNTLYEYLGEAEKLKVSKAGDGGMGNLRSASLELSNVDIADQFVNMILYQRGYQANSQIFSTTGDLLENTIALIR